MPTTPTADSTPFVGGREIAATLGVHRNTVLNWLDRGLLPSVRVGGRRKVTREAFEAFLRDGDVDGAA